MNLFCSRYPSLFTLLLSLCLCGVVTGAHAQVVINEFVAKNDSVGGYQEPDGGYGDWLELYNLGSSQVALGGYGLSDTTEMPARWLFPSGTVIGPGGYLIVWADNDEGQTGIHTNFKLSGEGEQIVLSLNGNILDQVAFGPQTDNVAMARVPNGTGPFVTQAPTPLANNGTTSARQAQPFQLKAYPSLTQSELRVEFGELSFESCRVIDALGGIVSELKVDAGNSAFTLDVSALPPGSYVLSFDGGRGLARFVRH